MTTCREWEEKILDLLVGELQPDQAEEVRTHLATCSTCTESAEAYRRSIALLQRAEGMDASADWARIGLPLRPPATGRRPRWMWGGLVAAAAAVAIWLLLGIPGRLTGPQHKGRSGDERFELTPAEWATLGEDGSLTGSARALGAEISVWEELDDLDTEDLQRLLTLLEAEEADWETNGG